MKELKSWSRGYLNLLKLSFFLKFFKFLLFICRSVTELVEFLTPKKLKEGEDIGRQSGSLQWRLNRGEMGDSIKNVNIHFYFGYSLYHCHNFNLLLKYR